MTVLSKPSNGSQDFIETLRRHVLGKDWSFGYNCYEVGHTWTPSCTDAALEISTVAALKVLPLYAMLYSFSQIAVNRKLDLHSTLDTVASTLRSSSFIFFHVYNGSAMACFLRHIFGRFYYRLLVCIPALLSCYLSLAIEKPARRQALAFYMLNLASEIVFKMLVTKGYFKPIRNGETILFALSMAAWFSLIRRRGFGDDPVSLVFKILIGRQEAPRRTRKRTTNAAPPVSDPHADSAYNVSLEKLPPKCKLHQESHTTQSSVILEQQLWKRLVHSKHQTCPHSEATCAHYVTGLIPSRFAIGFAVQAVLKLVSKPHLLITNPASAASQALASSANIRFGLFVATLVSSGRLVSCSLRNYSNSNSCAWHAPVAGFVSGLSMLWAPHSSISMYMMCKAVEQYYLQAARAGQVRYFEFTIVTIYAASAATLLYTFALEPRFIRASYMKFLDSVSNHRLHQLNRMVLDVFGTGSSVGYEDYFPDLHPQYMSREFKELIFNWLIQPH